MATINGFGVVVEIVYVTLYLVFSPPRARVSFSTLMSIIIIYNIIMHQTLIVMILIIVNNFL